MGEDKPRKLGSYVLKRLLGHGNMGTVYLAEDEVNGRPAALKVLPASFAANSAYARRFMTEARIATQLDHPNIVKVYDYGRERDHYYLAMEYTEGQSVRARIATAGRLPWQEGVEIALQVAEGLRAAADQGIIHRDVKPENLLIDSAGHVRIADLGLAKEAGVDEPLPNDTSLGTPDYMSPEQVSNSETVDFRTDIYSLGATLFHAICGKAPYTGHSAYEVMVKHVSAPLPSARKYVPDLPAEVCDVMRKAMARDREDRYQTYEQLLADLRALLAGEPVAATEFSDESMLGTNGSSLNGRSTRVGASARRGLLWVVAAALPVLGGVGMLVYLLVSD